MKPQFATIILLASVAVGHAHAESTVYLCVDAKGNKEYTNTPSKGCKKMSLPGLTTVSAPKRTSASAANGAKSASANGFPKVNEQTQKTRDSDRKQILQDELRMEEEKLAKLKAEYKGGEPERNGDEKNYAKYQERTAKMKEEVERAEKNVEALKREIGNLK
jgi:hypothetical protein